MDRELLDRINKIREKWANFIGIHMKHSKKREMVNEIINLYGGIQNE